MTRPRAGNAASIDMQAGQADAAEKIEQLELLLGAAREAQARVQSALDLRNSALDAATAHFMIVAVLQPSWAIVYANRAIAKDHGYGIAELLGASPAMLVPPELNGVAFQRIGAAVREGVSVSTELTARRKDGSTFSVGMYMAPVRGMADVVSHYIGIGADITSCTTARYSRQTKRLSRTAFPGWP